MNVEELRAYALSLPGTNESFPFDNNTLVFKVLTKMFLLVSLERQPLQFNFKALPENNLAYRENYPAVRPGYHSNKKHWSTVTVDGSIPERELKTWIKDSYDLVVAKLTKKQQASL
jgi:predicted DNA-binding protein (MmcQ/YjbR family)